MSRRALGPIVLLLAWIAATGLPARGADDAKAAPARFKLAFRYFEAEAEPTHRGEFLVVGDRGYEYVRGSDEIILIDGGRKVVTLLDLGRSVHAEIPFADLDARLETQRGRLQREVDANKVAEDRADRLEAEADQDLIRPRFTVRDGPTPNSVVLANPTTEVTAQGQPEPDPGRRAILRLLLDTSAKLRAIREPDLWPPYSSLETWRILLDDRKLRPEAVAYQFRTAGATTRYRWTFELTPDLGPRDLEAIQRLADFLPRTRRVRFEATPPKP